MLLQRGWNLSRGRRAARFSGIALAFVAAIAWCSAVKAALIVNDTWQDSSRADPASPTYSEKGVDSDSDTDLESAWFSSPGAALPQPTPGHLIMTQQTGSSVYTTYFTPEASELDLTPLGSKLTLTWKFTPKVAVAQANTSQN